MPKTPNMKFPLPVLKEKINFGTSNISVVAGSTVYIYCGDQLGETTGTFDATETLRAIYLVTRKGILRNLIASSSLAPGVGETFVYTVMVNGVPTALTVTISGAVQVWGSDLVNAVRVIVGDYVSLQLVTSAAASVTVHIASFSLETPSTRLPYDHVSFSSGTYTCVAGTRYLYSTYKANASGGASTIIALFTQSSHMVCRKGTMKNLVCKANAAAGAAESFVYTVMVNNIASALTVTISGAVQVTNMDAVNVVPVSLGDRITLRIVTSAGATVVTHGVSFDFEEGDYRAG